MKPNRKADLYFYYLLKEKVLLVDEAGNIYETVTKRTIPLYNVGGYKRVSYHDYSIQAHRLIWMAFNCLIPEGLQINHKNGIKNDNLPSNLELATNAENVKHAYITGLRSISEEEKRQSSGRMLGEKNVNAKFSDKDVLELRQKYDSSLITVKEIRENFNVSRRAIEDMLLGRSYKHVPFRCNKLNPKKQSRYKNKLDKKEVNTIRRLYSTKRYTQLELAEKFEVSRSTIKDIINNRTYKNTERPVPKLLSSD